MTGVRILSAGRNRLLALGAAMAVSIVLAGSQAQSASEDETIAGVEMAALADPARKTFTPSAEAQFEEAFAHLEGNLAVPVLPDHAVDITEIEPPSGPVIREDLGRGVASYYGRRFAGRPTASGETFNPQELTAAHKTLPFGSRVRVTNARNGQSVIVRVNDRGPFVRGRVIDLSRAAAEEIGMINSGHATVQLELLES